ncbi:MAG: hypothetical protein NVSMB17_06030 [Candidatus Dormibacteria bacterium]
MVTRACGLLEHHLHRHAGSLTRQLRAVPQREEALLAVLEAVRASPPHAVAPSTLASALEEVEALVKDHGRHLGSRTR